MGEKYGLLYDQWEVVADRAVKDDNVDEWRNVRAIYEHFRNRFIEGIELQRDNNKRRKLNEMDNGVGDVIMSFGDQVVAAKLKDLEEEKKNQASGP